MKMLQPILKTILSFSFCLFIQISSFAQCELSNLTITTGPCINGDLFEITIDVDTMDLTQNFFDWEIPGVASGFDSFDNLPLLISIMNTNIPVMEFVMCVNDNTNCCADAEFTNPCFANCEIDNVVSTVSNCNNNLFDITIDFAYANVSDSFQVVGNGMNYGNFAYVNTPITLTGLAADCSTYYEFVVVDLDNPNCSDFSDHGIVCCGTTPCELSNLVLTPGPCVNGITFDLVIDFDTTGITNAFFDWEVPGEGSGFESFDNLPFVLTLENNTNDSLEVYICVNDNPNCCIDGAFANPCYSNATCEIWDMTSTLLACEVNDFDIEIDFLYANVSDSFNLVGNGINYGNFAYVDLPITLLTLDADCTTEYEFVAIDLVDQNCSADIDHGTVCCSTTLCELSNLSLTTGSCINGDLFELTVDFDTSGITNNFFDWEIPGLQSGFESFDNLPMILSIFNNTQDSFEIYICVNDNPNCCIDGAFANPCYNGNATCEIWDMEVTDTFCYNSLFDVTLNFLHANVSDSFNLAGNGLSYGIFAYVDLPITVVGLDADCSTEYEFVAIDQNEPNCSDFVDLGIVCCTATCEIFDLTIDIGDCINNELFEIEIDFEYVNAGNDFFDWEIPGEGSGTSLLADLPLSISIDNDSDEYLLLEICINDNSNCCIEEEFENPCFVNSNCELWDMEAVVTDCVDSTYNIVINFLHANTSDSFKIVGNGMNYGNFAYADLPITITDLEADCSLEYEFVVMDLDFPNCTVFQEVGVVCCNACELSNLSLNLGNCINGDMFEVTLDFNYSGTTNDYFDWEIPGVVSGTDLFTNLPIVIQVLNNTSEVLDIVICENDNANCCISGVLDNPCFTGMLCSIDDVTAIELTCANDTFSIEIDFLYNNVSDSFYLAGNGMSYGLFAYADLPITLSDLPADCTTFYEFVATDSADPNCSDYVEHGDVCCTNLNRITNVDLSQLPVENDEIYLDFNLEHTSLPGCIIEVYVNGVLEEELDYLTNEFQLGPFLCEDNTDYLVEIKNSCRPDEVLESFSFNFEGVACTVSTENIWYGIKLNYDANRKVAELDNPNEHDIIISILDFNGGIWMQKEVTHSRWAYRLTDVPSGIYLIKMQLNSPQDPVSTIKKILVY